MYLGGNRRWVPLSFENNNNKKTDRPHLPFSCIAKARFCLFLRRKILVLLHQFGQHIVE